MRKIAWLLALWICALPSMAKAQKAIGDSSEADWPAMIAELRRQLDRMPSNNDVRHQLAIAYNNYGVQLGDQDNFSDAIRQLQDAARLEPSESQFQTNLTLLHLKAAQTAYQDYRLAEARTMVAEAVKISPNHSEAYALLGEIEYHSQHLKEAKAAWERAAQMNPELDGIQDRLAQLSQELPVESEFEKVSQAHFDIRYTEQLARSTGYDIRDALLKARREVGSDFSLWPTRKLIVLVYSPDQFRQLRKDTPEWVAGQYDGKIRVPLPGNGYDEASVIRTLYHEYTHALVHEMTGVQCPTWLNEGLAEYEAWKREKPPWTGLRKAVETNMLIPWDRLSSRISGGRAAQDVALAYEQSHSIVKYFVERYGFWRMRRVLKAVADGADLVDTLTAEFHMKLPRLQSTWRAWLDEQLAAR